MGPQGTFVLIILLVAIHRYHDRIGLDSVSDYYQHYTVLDGVWTQKNTPACRL